MRGKLIFITGVGVGYVLGTRAGRERFDQMVAQARKFWESPTVQQQVEQAKAFAREQAPVVQEQLAAAAKRAVDRASSSSPTAG